MEKFVIDTNFFINLEIKSGFGTNATENVIEFTKLAQKLKTAKKAEFFMPPRVVEELKGFFTDMRPIDEFLTVVTVKSPTIDDKQFPARIFYQFVDEVRERSYRGLRVAEEAVFDGGRRTAGITEIKGQAFQQTVGQAVKTLREKYRQATRFNFLDSIADLDIIVLAIGQDAFLVTSDEGVIRWGRIFGAKEIEASNFRSRLLSLLSEHHLA